jgi:hypothetical protein
MQINVDVVDLSSDEGDEVREKEKRRCKFLPSSVSSQCSLQLVPDTKRPKHASEPEPVDADGILVDIDVTEVAVGGPKARREDASRDINAFFDDPHPVTLSDGRTKSYRNCKKCS